MSSPKLTAEVIAAIGQYRPGIISTAGKSGRPNVSVKGSTQVIDGELVFADMRSPRTVANLKENPQISIIGLDFATRKGYRIWGKVEVLASGPLFDKLCAKIPQGKPNHCIHVQVDEAILF